MADPRLDTLATILGKTTSLLPNALFASLGMPREESLTDVKHVSYLLIVLPCSRCGSLSQHYPQGIDHELKRACEDVIASCADTVCKPLRFWLERVAQHNALPQHPPLAAQGWASDAAVSALLTGFREACLRDLRAAVARLKLYLEEERTVAVLVKHVQERVVDEYAEFRRVVWAEYDGPVRGEVSNEESLRALLQEACDADSDASTPAGASNRT